MPRVLLIDDNDDVRFMLRLKIEARPSFQVVGEAADGRAGVGEAERTQPDIVILDHDMPVATGTEVLPDLRRVCPDCVIVLFTADVNASIREAALAGGAHHIRQKDGDAINSLVDDLAQQILGPSGSDEMIELRLGPIDAAVARAWITHTGGLLTALLAQPEELPDGVGVDVVEDFQGFLDRWAAVAGAGDEFQWAAAAPAATIERLVGAWAQIDQLSDEAMDRLGCEWSGPDARPFFDELTAAVVVAIERAGLARLRDELPAAWPADSTEPDTRRAPGQGPGAPCSLWLGGEDSNPQ